MTNMDNYCVIMGGGIGSRFWPFSRKTLPKQFLDFFGTGRSLLQQTFDRFQKVIPTENIFIVTNAIIILVCHDSDSILKFLLMYGLFSEYRSV